MHDDGWIPLRRLGDKFTFGAMKIKVLKPRESRSNQHRENQAEAEGSVRIFPKHYDTSNYPTGN